MKLTCPHCGVTGSIDDKFLGRKLKCPKCGQDFKATEDDAVPTAGPAGPPPLPKDTPQKSVPAPRNKSNRSPDKEEQPEQAEKTAVCTGCGKTFPEDELIELEGQQICAACKPALLQKLREGAVETGSGGLEAGIAGRYSFQTGEVLSEAWEKVKGAKGTIFGGVFVMYVTSFLLGFICKAALSMLGIDQNNIVLTVITQLGLQLISMTVTVLFTGGLMMMGVRRAADEPISFSMLFDGFAKAKPLVIAMIFQSVMIIIGFALLIIPGIYLSIGYGLTYPLIMEKELGPWEAMEASRKAIHHHWFQIFGLYFVMGLIFMLSALPLGIGLIWTLPMGVITLGIVYRTVFGTEE
jgi:hypothetical protein